MVQIRRADVADRKVQEPPLPTLSPESNTQFERSVENLGKALSTVSGQIFDAEVLRLSTEAQNQARTRIAEIQAEFAQDNSTDFEGKKAKYAAMMEQVKQFGSNIPSIAAQQKTQGAIATTADIANINLQQAIFGQQVENAKSQQEVFETGLEEDYAATLPSNANGRLAIENAIIEKSEEYIAAGLISDPVAERERVRIYIEEELPKARARKMIDTNPVLAAQMLATNQFGIKDGEERRRLQTQAEQALKARKAEAEFIANVDQEKDLLKAYDDIINNNLDSLEKIESFDAPDEEKALMREIHLSGKRLTATDELASIQAIEDAIDLATKKITDKAKVVDGVRFAAGEQQPGKTESVRAIGAARRALGKAMALGTVSDGTRNSLKKRIDKMMDFALRGEIDRGFDASNRVWGWFDLWGNTFIAEDRKTEAKIFLRQQMYKYLDRNPDATEDQIQDQANLTIGRFLKESDTVKLNAVLEKDASGNQAWVYPDFTYQEVLQDGSLGPLKNPDGSKFEVKT